MSNDNYRRLLIRHNRAMETGEPSIVHSPEFHDIHLLRQAWAVSPFNKKQQSLQNNDNDKPKSHEGADRDVLKEIYHAMFFQPMSGFCGMATVNTVLNSLEPPYYFRYPTHGRGYSMYSLAEYLILYCVPYQFTDVDAIFMNRNTTLEQFRDILLRYANSPEYRLLANFHRTPLFYSERSTEEEARYRAWAGHWSPVGGYLQTQADGKEYVLVLDTNDKYGPFMVSLERFFQAVKTETLEDGYRGFLKVKLLHPTTGASSGQAAAPAPSPSPIRLGDSVDC